MNRGVIACVLLLASVAAAAPGATARLETSGVCELDTVTTRANELLGRAAIAPDAKARISVISAGTDDVVASLTFIDENGVAQPARTITADRCSELAESVAIVISLVLREAPPPASPPPPPLPPAPREDDTSYAPVSRTLRHALELGASVGSTKDTALVLGARVERERIALGADLAVTLPTTVDVGAGAAHVMAVRLDAAGCWRASGFAACGLVIGGLAAASGEDLMDARTVVRPIAAVAARAEWRQPVSERFGLRLFASFEQLLVRPRVLVDDMPVWTAAWRQAWLGAGIFFRMP